MKEHLLTLPDGYDIKKQRLVGTFAAQLDAQHEMLRKAVEGLTVVQLEWQLRPGMNTIGMLMAHIAIAEIFWINIAPNEIEDKTEWDRIIKDLIGILGHEDGMPLPADGKHPQSLACKTLDQYLTMLDTARATTAKVLGGWTDNHLETAPNITGKVLEAWTDERLSSTFVLENDYRFSRIWALYHVLEHLSGHIGQISLLKHIMHDKGVLS